jgi:hypothetical protein
MPNFLANLGSYQLSFWIGFAAGCLFWWFQIRFRKALPDIRIRIANFIQVMRHGITANTEARFRNDTLRYAQGLHLAAPLFSLDEILVKPRLLMLPVEFQTNDKIVESDQPALEVPYLPDWPMLALAFHEPLMSLAEAVSGGANLILIGLAGSGKTCALAYLATTILRQSEEAGSLKGFLPLLIHSGDLTLTLGLPGDPLETLVAAAAVHASPLTLPRLKTVISNELEQGKIVLLLDGLDELTKDPVELIVDFLVFLRRKYPKTRIVAAASPEYFDGLSGLGFIPVALAAWDEQQKLQFIQGWGELWKRFIERPAQEGQERVDNLLINNWLAGLVANCTPFEITLKVWQAYAGDALGASNPDAIESYLARMCVRIPKARQVLEKLALQMVVERMAIVEAKAADRWMPELAQEEVVELLAEPVEPEEAPSPAEASEPGKTGEQAENLEIETEQTASLQKAEKPPVKVTLSLQRILYDLVNCGLLYTRKDQRVSFIHPIIQGYLAGKALTSTGDFHCLEDQTDWTGGKLAMRYFLSWVDQSQLIIPMLNTKDDPLFRQLLTAGGFLPDALPSAPWRHQVRHRLASMLQNDLLATSLRARAMCALVSSGDPGVAVLIRQLLVNRQESVRLLAIFGAGMLRDVKTVQDLIGLIEDPSLMVQQAAIPALASIGTKSAIDALLQTLIQSSEDLRRLAAEGLACFPEIGYPALKEGSTHEDILIRRAVVYGLARVNQDWSMEILQKMQMEDEQWVVRSAATQALEELQSKNIHLPCPFPPLNETPWLISYAGKQGMGVSPGKPAQNILRQALINGDEEEKETVLKYLSIIPDVGVVPQLYQLIYGDRGRLKEMACNALWHLSATGIELPSPTQFGLG